MVVERAKSIDLRLPFMPLPTEVVKPPIEPRTRLSPTISRVGKKIEPGFQEAVAEANAKLSDPANFKALGVEKYKG